MSALKLVEEFPWLSASDLTTLEKKPWLAVFIEKDDRSLDEAIQRHRLAQTEARIQLYRRGREAHQRMVVRGGIQTTAYEDTVHKEMK